MPTASPCCAAQARSPSVHGSVHHLTVYKGGQKKLPAGCVPLWTKGSVYIPRAISPDHHAGGFLAPYFMANILFLLRQRGRRHLLALLDHHPTVPRRERGSLSSGIVRRVGADLRVRKVMETVMRLSRNLAVDFFLSESTRRSPEDLSLPGGSRKAPIQSRQTARSFSPRHPRSRCRLPSCCARLNPSSS